jgi:hypothetical protein
VSPRRILAAVALGACFVGAFFAKRRTEASEWPGVDESVIGRFVAEAGRPAPRPLFDWVRGDTLLFAFLWAGLAAGFLLGFWGRALFVERAGAPAERTDDPT